YESFAGTLPAISRIEYALGGVGLSVDPTEMTLPLCLAHATEFPVAFALGFLLGLEVGVYVGSTLYMHMRGFRISCGTGELEVSGSGPVTVLNSTARITIRLI